MSSSYWLVMRMLGVMTVNDARDSAVLVKQFLPRSVLRVDYVELPLFVPISLGTSDNFRVMRFGRKAFV